MLSAPTNFVSRVRATTTAANFGWLLTDRIVRIFLGITVNVVLARALGPETFGQFAYALTLAGLFMPFSTLGTERIVVRELARDQAEPAMLGTVVVLRLAGAAIGWLLAILVATLTTESARAGSALLTAVVVGGNLLLSFDVIGWAFQARGDFRPATLARLAAFVLGATVKIILAKCGIGLVWIAAAVLLESAVGAFLQWVVWQRAVRPATRWHFERKLARLVLIASAPLLAAEIAVWIFQKIDVVILQRSASAEAIGIYTVAQRVAQAGYFLPVAAVQVFSPSVAQARDAATALALVQRTMIGLVSAAYTIALGLSLASVPLVHGLFGNKYASAANVLAILAWSNVFVFMGCAHSLYLVNRGQQALSLRLAWLTAMVSVGLNLLLIPRFQAIGAAVANVLTYALTTVFGVALYAGSRPLLAVNLRSLVGPLLLARTWFQGRRRQTARAQ